MHVDVAGEKYIIRRDEEVTPVPWSPNRLEMEVRMCVRRAEGVRCAGEGREKRIGEGVGSFGVVDVLEETEGDG